MKTSFDLFENVLNFNYFNFMKNCKILYTVNSKQELFFLTDILLNKTIKKVNSLNLEDKQKQNEINSCLDFLALLYIARNEIQKLLIFYKIKKQHRIIELLSNDFTVDRWKKALINNAYKLIQIKRYYLAIAFFILLNNMKDVIDVIHQYLRDPQLSVFLVHLIYVAYQGEHHIFVDSDAVYSWEGTTDSSLGDLRGGSKEIDSVDDTEETEETEESDKTEETEELEKGKEMEGLKGSEEFVESQKKKQKLKLKQKEKGTDMGTRTKTETGIVTGTGTRLTNFTKFLTGNFTRGLSFKSSVKELLPQWKRESMLMEQKILRKEKKLSEKLAQKREVKGKDTNLQEEDLDTHILMRGKSIFRASSMEGRSLSKKESMLIEQQMLIQESIEINNQEQQKEKKLMGFMSKNAETVTRVVSRDMSLMMSRGMSGQVSRGLSREMSRGMSREMSRGMSREMSRGLSREVSKEIFTGLSREMSRGMPRMIPKEMSRGFSREMSKEMPRGFSREMSGEISRGVSRMIPKQMSREMSMGISMEMGGRSRSMPLGTYATRNKMIYKKENDMDTIRLGPRRSVTVLPNFNRLHHTYQEHNVFKGYNDVSIKNVQAHNNNYNNKNYMFLKRNQNQDQNMSYSMDRDLNMSPNQSRNPSPNKNLSLARSLSIEPKFAKEKLNEAYTNFYAPLELKKIEPLNEFFSIWLKYVFFKKEKNCDKFLNIMKFLILRKYKKAYAIFEKEALHNLFFLILKNVTADVLMANEEQQENEYTTAVAAVAAGAAVEAATEIGTKIGIKIRESERRENERREQKDKVITLQKVSLFLKREEKEKKKKIGRSIYDMYFYAHFYGSQKMHNLSFVFYFLFFFNMKFFNVTEAYNKYEHFFKLLFESFLEKFSYYNKFLFYGVFPHSFKNNKGIIGEEKLTFVKFLSRSDTSFVMGGQKIADKERGIGREFGRELEEKKKGTNTEIKNDELEHIDSLDNFDNFLFSIKLLSQIINTLAQLINNINLKGEYIFPKIFGKRNEEEMKLERFSFSKKSFSFSVSKKDSEHNVYSLRNSKMGSHDIQFVPTYISYKTEKTENRVLLKFIRKLENLKKIECFGKQHGLNDFLVSLLTKIKSLIFLNKKQKKKYLINKNLGNKKYTEKDIHKNKNKEKNKDKDKDKDKDITFNIIYDVTHEKKFEMTTHFNLYYISLNKYNKMLTHLFFNFFTLYIKKGKRSEIIIYIMNHILTILYLYITDVVHILFNFLKHEKNKSLTLMHIPFIQIILFRITLNDYFIQQKQTDKKRRADKKYTQQGYLQKEYSQKEYLQKEYPEKE